MNRVRLGLRLGMLPLPSNLVYLFLFMIAVEKLYIFITFLFFLHDGEDVLKQFIG